MMENERIRDLARAIAAQYGVEASLAVARERARMWREAGDGGWTAVWMEVGVELRDMHPSAKPSSAQRTLPELLDDPMMTAVLGDDDQGRREVVETLSAAKRRLRR